MKIKLLNILTVIAAIITFLLGFNASAQGVGVGAFDISHPDKKNQPSDAPVELHLKNGDNSRGKIYLTNLSDEETSLFIYAAAALPARNGGIALRNRDKAKTGLAKWITLPVNEVKLSPRERKTITYKIKIPLVTKASEYIAGIVAETTEPLKNEGKQFSINVVQRAALILNQRLPGPLIEKLLFLSFTKTQKKDKISFDLVLENTGNVHLDPKAKIYITDIFGRRVDTLKLSNLGTVFPEKTAKLKVKWKNPPLLGWFTAGAVATYGGNKRVKKTIKFFIFPWWLLLLIVVTITLLILAIWRRRAAKKEEVNSLATKEVDQPIFPEGS